MARPPLAPARSLWAPARLLLAAAWLFVVAALPAQTAGVMTRISATAKDALFLVDGQVFTGTAAFTWPAGSKHTLGIPAWQYGTSLKSRYVFEHWSAPPGPLPSPSNYVTITADAGIPWYNADQTTEYAISLVFFQCAQAPCASPGTIWVDQAAYREDTDIWVEAGATVLIQATPNAGFVFAGWGQSTAASLYTLVVNQPVTLYPTFAVARAIQLLTSPDGLQLLADRAPVSTPVTLEWGFGTTHSLAAVSPQWDRNGRLWLLKSWSDGGSASHNFQVTPGAATATVVAEFVRAVAVLIDSDPAGLRLTVDGLDAAAPQHQFWGPGDSHTVAAPAKQTDSGGGPWVFRSWSNGAANPQKVTAADSQVDSGIRLTAMYDPLSRIRVNSVPAGLPLTVDGAECRTPCEVERGVGSTVKLGAPASVATGDGVRLDFATWEGAAGGTFTATAGYRKVTARYGAAYRLSLGTEPAGAGKLRLSPATADGYYPAGTAVTLAADAADGMTFRGWALDLNGSANPATLAMDAPHAVEAWFDRAPETPPPPRVGNAAGETPSEAVAPGSIASLFGTGLAESTAEGATDPLPQSLAGVTLRAGGRWLPLLYVSPSQINFQVPSDLEPGPYRLDLLRENAPPAEVRFTVTRNAPGLFLAVHADGSPVTEDSPARAGERIILYGTGVGALVPRPLDGFRVPAAPAFGLEDAVEVLLDGHVLAPDWAGALAGAVGVAAIHVRLPDDLAGTATANVTVRAGGVKSNSLPLPVR